MFVFFLKGILVGLGVAAPVGPIGVLCIRRTLSNGRMSGFFSGLGAASADTFYGIVAVFGLTMISDFLVAQEVWFRLVGGCFLIYLGCRIFVSRLKSVHEFVLRRSLLSDFTTTFLLTLTNPMTVLAYVAVFAGIGISDKPMGWGHAVWLCFGTFLGSTLWWLILSEGVTIFRKRINHAVMIWINRSAGALIVLFGLLAWLSIYF